MVVGRLAFPKDFTMTTALQASFLSRAQRVRIIQEIVCAHYSVEVDFMLSRSKLAHHVRPRHLAMSLAREILGYSSHELAVHFNRGNHATVIHARHQMDDLQFTDSIFADEYAYLRSQCFKLLGLKLAKKLGKKPLPRRGATGEKLGN
jgi:chromosomal replication initiation ATPase DnaA